MLNHPAFQSLVLPLLATLVALALTGGARPAKAAWWAGLGACAGLLLALAYFPGFDWPATARAQKFPWIVLAAGVAALGIGMLPLTRTALWPHWAVAAAIWAVASLWLLGGRAPGPNNAAWWLLGAVVLALLLISAGGLRPVASAPMDGDQRGTAAVAVLAAMAGGLAAMAALGGSLLIAQLAMALAVAIGAWALWCWLVPSATSLIGRAAVWPLGIAWLALAQTLSGTVAQGLARSGLMGASLLLAWALGKTGWASRHPRWLPWVAVLCAAVPVALALLPFWGDGAADAAGDAGTSAEDPYYQSDWD